MCALLASGFFPPFRGETPQLPIPGVKVTFGSGRRSFSAEVWAGRAKVSSSQSLANFIIDKQGQRFLVKGFLCSGWRCRRHLFRIVVDWREPSHGEWPSSSGILIHQMEKPLIQTKVRCVTHYSRSGAWIKLGKNPNALVGTFQLWVRARQVQGTTPCKSLGEMRK